jgi:hypothetical protein
MYAMKKAMDEAMVADVITELISNVQGCIVVDIAIYANCEEPATKS